MTIDNKFAPLRIGQRVRITKQRHLPGAPVLDAASWVDDVTEGLISSFQRVDGGLMVAVSQSGGDPVRIYIGVAWFGPMLNPNGTKVEILADAPEQTELFEMRRR